MTCWRSWCKVYCCTLHSLYLPRTNLDALSSERRRFRAVSSVGRMRLSYNIVDGHKMRSGVRAPGGPSFFFFFPYVHQQLFQVLFTQPRPQTNASSLVLRQEGEQGSVVVHTIGLVSVPDSRQHRVSACPRSLWYGQRRPCIHRREILVVRYNLPSPPTTMNMGVSSENSSAGISIAQRYGER